MSEVKGAFSNAHEKGLNKLLAEKDEIEKKIDSAKDLFLAYGYIKQREEIITLIRILQNPL